MYKGTFLPAILYCTCLIAQGQDSTFLLPIIEIREAKLNELERSNAIDITNNYSSTSISESISRAGAGYIKSYGLGSLATLTSRGASTSQTTVTWNGIPLQSPSLGLLDLGQISAGIFDKVSLLPGGNSTLQGSGAIGGILEMINTPPQNTDQEVKTQLNTGSFGHWSLNLNLKLNFEHIYTTTKLYSLIAKNDFEYRPHPSLPKTNQSNAQVNRKGVMQTIGINFKNNSQLILHYWGQLSDMGIPPTLHATQSSATQKDNFHRGLVQWKWNNQKWVLNTSIALFDEFNDYDDPTSGVMNSNHFTSLKAEISSRYIISRKHQILMGVYSENTKAYSAHFSTPPSQSKSDLYISYFLNADNWQANLGLRQSLINGKSIPLIPTLSGNYHITPALGASAKISFNYRVPTLNDLHWVPGGNIDLAPESGWSQELKLRLKHPKSTYDRHISLVIYNRIIDNWILWSRPQNSFFFHAFNLNKVWSRGLEVRTAYEFSLGELEFETEIGYQYTNSTYQSDVDNPSLKKGDQLFYTPIHMVHWNQLLTWKAFSLALHHRHTGEVVGFNEDVSAFYLGSAGIRYNYKFNNLKGHLNFQIENIWDADYRVIENRPMPGRYFNVGLLVESNFKSKNK